MIRSCCRHTYPLPTPALIGPSLPSASSVCPSFLLHPVLHYYRVALRRQVSNIFPATAALVERHASPLSILSRCAPSFSEVNCSRFERMRRYCMVHRAKPYCTNVLHIYRDAMENRFTELSVPAIRSFHGRTAGLAKTSLQKKKKTLSRLRYLHGQGSAAVFYIL